MDIPSLISLRTLTPSLPFLPCYVLVVARIQIRDHRAFDAYAPVDVEHPEPAVHTNISFLIDHIIHASHPAAAAPTNPMTPSPVNIENRAQSAMSANNAANVVIRMQAPIPMAFSTFVTLVFSIVLSFYLVLIILLVSAISLARKASMSLTW